ncbi:hypothetical protein NC652_012487 [Populus alba x Populus x berolinensis]|nr:hypothetical protein NC652_012487 [Populus alba x Populus x berolinensis]
MGWSRLNHSLSDNSKAVEYETREGVRAGLQLRTNAHFYEHPRQTIPWAAQYSAIAGSQTRRRWWLNFKPSLPVPVFGLGVVDLLMLPAAYHVIAE